MVWVGSEVRRSWGHSAGAPGGEIDEALRRDLACKVSRPLNETSRLDELRGEQGSLCHVCWRCFPDRNFLTGNMEHHAS